MKDGAAPLAAVLLANAVDCLCTTGMRIRPWLGQSRTRPACRVVESLAAPFTARIQQPLVLRLVSWLLGGC